MPISVTGDRHTGLFCIHGRHTSSCGYWLLHWQGLPLLFTVADSSKVIKLATRVTGLTVGWTFGKTMHLTAFRTRGFPLLRAMLISASSANVTASCRLILAHRVHFPANGCELGQQASYRMAVGVRSYIRSRLGKGNSYDGRYGSKPLFNIRVG